MELKFKKLEESAIIPTRAHVDDAGIDLFVSNVTTELNEVGQLLIVYHSGVAVEIPNGYVGLLFPRSSISKKSLTFTNSVGVIDSGYRGEITAKMKATTDSVPSIYQAKDKFAQLVIVPYLSDVEIVESTELSETDRGEGGYGSTDNISAEQPSDVEKVNAVESTDVNMLAQGQEDGVQAEGSKGSDIVG